MIRAPRCTRRTLLLRGVAGGMLGAGLPLAAVLGASPAAWAATEDPERRRLRRQAIERGCRYIVSKRRADGGFGDNNAVVAITSLSVLALMAQGSTDGRGPYGEEIRRGIDFLLSLVEQPRHRGAWHEGYFYYPHDRSSRMHGQGYATLALASAIGTATGPRYAAIRRVLHKAVACIEQSQTTTGGFGYDPTPGGDHEGSVTVTVAQGLRAARDAGIPVDENVVQKGLRYLKRSQKPDGSFRYSVYVQRSSYALTAAALSSFFLYGRYTDDANRTIHRGLQYMMDKLPDVKVRRRWYYYGNFYAAWATWQHDGGEWDPRSRGYWARWQREMLPHLLKEQTNDGRWTDRMDQFGFGDVLPTAFAVLTLAIPDEVLPVFQR